jgi:hypothetical protein
MIPPPIPPQFRPAKRSLSSEIAEKSLEWLLGHPPVLALFLSLGLVSVILLLVIATRPHDEPVALASQAVESKRPAGGNRYQPRYKRWVSPAGRLQIGTQVFIKVLSRQPSLIFTVVSPVDPDNPDMMIVSYPNGSVERKLRSAFTNGDDDIKSYVVWDYD